MKLNISYFVLAAELGSDDETVFPDLFFCSSMALTAEGDAKISR
jgi:hypothetical protein